MLPKNIEDLYKILVDKVNEMGKKLDNLQVSHAVAYPSNNIVINSCQPGPSQTKHDISTQTDGLNQVYPDHMVQAHEDGASQAYEGVSVSPPDSSIL